MNKDLSFKDFYEISGFLAKHFKKRKIIIRPHPEEDINRYKHLEKKFKNLIIDNHTSRIDQLKSVRPLFTLMHYVCTSIFHEKECNHV